MQVHRIELPTPFPVGPVNTFLLAGDPLTLVDAGPKTLESQEALERGIAAVGYRLENIRRIVLTHGHTDHFGNADWVRQRSEAEILGHEADKPKFTGKRSFVDHIKTFFAQAGLPDTFLPMFVERLRAIRALFDPLPRISWLADGATVTLNGESLRVLHCPGHSIGHICLYHEDGILLAGDLLLEEVSPNPIVEFEPDGTRIPTLPQYLQSLRRVLLLNCEVAYPGHGPPIVNPGARIRELIAHHEQRKEEIAARLGSTPKTLVTLCQEIYQKLDEMNLMLALSEVVGHLDLLMEENRVKVTRRKGRLLYTVR